MACTKYFDSQFMRRLNVNNLVDVLNEALEVLPKKNGTNLSMDGPSTNWVILKSIQKQQQESEVPTLVNLQNCGLHIIFGAFQMGIVKVGWELEKVRFVKKMV